jgi:SAM-dependent methyltransferase
MKKIFIDKNINVYEGISAEKLIENKNDSTYLKNNSIMSVDKVRWEEAQDYEKKTWMVNNKYASDDRNFFHYENFDSYNELINFQKKTKINKVIELGCGPFTNIRTILNILPHINEIHLLDPLLDDYLHHPNCFYKEKKILNHDVFTYSIPIEEFDTQEKYDMVLINNVLEHCYDINKIFNIIKNILKPNGLLIFSDVYFKNDDANKMVFEIYDAGHPLKLSEEFLISFIANFNLLYEKDFHNLYDQHWRNDKYFIGTIKK